MTTRRHGEVVPVLGEPGQPCRELGRVRAGRLPRADPQVDAGGVVGEVQAHPSGERLVEVVDHGGRRPPDRRGKRLGVGVRLRRPRDGSRDVGHDDPRPVGRELGGGREVVEEERCDRLHAVGMQPVPDPRQQVAEASGVHGRRARPRGRGGRSSGTSSATGPNDTSASSPVDSCVEAENPRIDATSSPSNSSRTGRGADPREHVDDPAAHGELATVLDEVGPPVTEVDEPLGEGVERGAPAREHGLGPRQPERRGPRRASPRAPGPRSTAGPPPERSRCTASARRAATSALGEIPRTAGPPTRGAARPRPAGRRSPRRRAPRPRAGPRSRRGPGSRGRRRPPRRRTPGRRRRARRSAVPERAAARRTARTRRARPRLPAGPPNRLPAPRRAPPRRDGACGGSVRRVPRRLRRRAGDPAREDSSAGRIAASASTLRTDSHRVYSIADSGFEM